MTETERKHRYDARFKQALGVLIGWDDPKAKTLNPGTFNALRGVAMRALWAHDDDSPSDACEAAEAALRKVAEADVAAHVYAELEQEMVESFTGESGYKRDVRQWSRRLTDLLDKGDSMTTHDVWEAQDLRREIREAAKKARVAVPKVALTQPTKREKSVLELARNKAAKGSSGKGAAKRKR